jgi:hypothetical protein
VTRAVLDDHLLRDLLADDLSEDLAGLLADYEPATTNLYLYRLCRSVVSARGGGLTGLWPAERRRDLARRLVVLPDTVEVVPLRLIAFRMAEIAAAHRVSTLGAEAVAAAEHVDAPLCVWVGDRGPAIGAAAADFGVPYQVIER